MNGEFRATAPLRRAGAADVAAVNALQHAAYARNRTILGVEPLPLTVDYATIVADYDVWLLERIYRIGAFGVLGALLLLTSYVYSRNRASIESWWNDRKPGA